MREFIEPITPPRTAALKKSAGIALTVLLVTVVGLIGWRAVRQAEPVYQRKPLSVWLAQYGTNHWSGASGNELAQQAETAIRQIGTNEIPAYLRMVSARESRAARLLESRP